jgi:hypothetical protein
MGTAICYNWKFGRCANVNALMKDGELTGVGKNFKIWSKKQVVPEHAYFLVLTAVFGVQSMRKLHCLHCPLNDTQGYINNPHTDFERSANLGD